MSDTIKTVKNMTTPSGPQGSRGLYLLFQEHSTLLPLSARNRLICATQVDVRACVGESPLRTLAVEEAVEHARRHYPQFFRR